MKPTVVNVVLVLFSLLFAGVNASVAAPKLEPISGQNFPSEVQPGQSLAFSMTYQGDPPTSLIMVVETPGGETIRVPAKASGGDPAAGVAVTWPFAPKEAGTYRYHFEAAAGDIGSVRYPDSPSGDFQFVSVSLVSKYVIFVIGLLVALLFLPFVVYVAARAANKRGDPAAAARVALLLGVLASYGLFLYLFFTVYGALSVAIGAVAALALLVVLFTRRRVA